MKKYINQLQHVYCEETKKTHKTVCSMKWVSYWITITEIYTWNYNHRFKQNCEGIKYDLGKTVSI